MTPAELKALDAAATKGPWQSDEPGNWHGLSARIMVEEPYAMIGTVEVAGWKPRSIGRSNAGLIAAARNALPALIRLWEASLLAREDAEQAAFLSGGVVHLTQNSLAFEAALRELREMKL